MPAGVYVGLGICRSGYGSWSGYMSVGLYTRSGISHALGDICGYRHGRYAVAGMEDMNCWAYVAITCELLGICQTSKNAAIGRLRIICVSLCVSIILDAVRRIYACQAYAVYGTGLVWAWVCVAIVRRMRMYAWDVQKRCLWRPESCRCMIVSLRGANALQALTGVRVGRANEAAKKPGNAIGHRVISEFGYKTQISARSASFSMAPLLNVKTTYPGMMVWDMANTGYSIAS